MGAQRSEYFVRTHRNIRSALEERGIAAHIDELTTNLLTQGTVSSGMPRLSFRSKAASVQPLWRRMSLAPGGGDRCLPVLERRER